MTDRINALIVVLEEDWRADDVATLAAAIRHMRGVADVKGHVSDIAGHVAEVRARQELADKLMSVLFPKPEKS
ncbi:MAG TPA: hypothetical protein VFV92_14520 [Candidatus Bathyarchaeia archaeon]|nr:hypothetical protein [Candidatus Bathyarchaeia archaeon]